MERHGESSAAADDDLDQRMTRLSDDAYRLAIAEADGTGERDARHERARAVDRELDELAAAIRAAAATSAIDLRELWTDARLDVAFVLTDGRAPKSLRLAAHTRG